MELDKTTAVISVCVVSGFIMFFGFIAINIRNGNEHYYRTFSQCIEKGGMWLSHNSGICIPQR
jgi:hypothetical protein